MATQLETQQNANAASAGNVVTDTSTPATDQNTAIISEIQNQLLNQSGSLSSSNTAIEDAINSAIGKTSTATEASKGATNLSFDRQVGEAKQAGEQQLTSFQEATRGFATNTAAMKQLTESTNKEVKDLESRRQELLLTADAAGAQQVSNLILQKLQFQQQAKQAAFTNLLSLGNFAMAQEGQNLQKRQLSFQEQESMAGIALQYGIELKPGDTLDTVTARALPFASEKQRAELNQMKAETARIKAETSKVIQDGKASNDPLVIATLAAAARKDPNVYNTIKDPSTYAKVVIEANKPQEYSTTELTAGIMAQKTRDVSYEDAKAIIESDDSILNKDVALSLVDKAYGKGGPAKKPTTLASTTIGLGNTVIGAQKSVLDFIFGPDNVNSPNFLGGVYSDNQ